MADRTSVQVFREMFTMLAENPSDEHKAMARRVWVLAQRHDFTWPQMEADDALIALDLASRCADPECPETGQMVVYHG